MITEDQADSIINILRQIRDLMRERNQMLREDYAWMKTTFSGHGHPNEPLDE